MTTGPTRRFQPGDEVDVVDHEGRVGESGTVRRVGKCTYTLTDGSVWMSDGRRFGWPDFAWRIVPKGAQPDALTQALQTLRLSARELREVWSLPRTKVAARASVHFKTVEAYERDRSHVCEQARRALDDAYTVLALDLQPAGVAT